MPIELHTRFFKPEGNTAKMTVLLRLDLRLFKFNKANGRNNSTVTMVTGIFDRDGNYVEGIKKTLELHLKDETLATRLTRGAVIKTGGARFRRPAVVGNECRGGDSVGRVHRREAETLRISKFKVNPGER